MPATAKAPASAKQRVIVMGAGSQHYFMAEGLPRYRGEVLPRQGVNMQLMLEQGSLAPVSREAAKEVVKCDCGREFVDDQARQAHVERGHDKEPSPAFGGLIQIEGEPELTCPEKAHHDLIEEGDKRVVTMWHPKTKQVIPRRRRDGSVAGEER